MCSRPILKISKFDGSIVKEYPSGRSCDADNNLYPGTTSATARRKILTVGEFIYRYKDEWTGHEVFHGRKNRPVIVYEESSEKFWWFARQKDACRAFFTKVSTNGRMPYCGLVARYVKSTDDVPKLMNLLGFSVTKAPTSFCRGIEQ